MQNRSSAFSPEGEPSALTATDGSRLAGARIRKPPEGVFRCFADAHSNKGSRQAAHTRPAMNHSRVPRTAPKCVPRPLVWPNPVVRPTAAPMPVHPGIGPLPLRRVVGLGAQVCPTPHFEGMRPSGPVKSVARRTERAFERTRKERRYRSTGRMTLCQRRLLATQPHRRPKSPMFPNFRSRVQTTAQVCRNPAGLASVAIDRSRTGVRSGLPVRRLARFPKEPREFNVFRRQSEVCCHP